MKTVDLSTHRFENFYKSPFTTADMRKEPHEDE